MNRKILHDWELWIAKQPKHFTTAKIAAGRNKKGLSPALFCPSNGKCYGLEVDLKMSRAQPVWVRPERRNRNVLTVHEDSEHRASPKWQAHNQ
ncbi:MAG: hypothetical protein KGL01_06240 [Betaproteobacteria bacterium]|nr:hypothetical protein [Betaproteobacteria bacterium]